MNNVIAFTGLKLKSPEYEVETAFVSLLEARCSEEGAIKPLSNTFFERIQRLKVKAEEAKQRQENALLEG
jgi:hypothetical protein